MTEVTEMELTLLRHGRTEANEQHLYCGSTDLHLSENGKTELLTLAASRPLPVFDVVADTGMHRTRETADLLCLGERRIAVPEFREMNFGLFEQKSYEMLRSDPRYIQWITDETGDDPCPQGESRNAFYTRVRNRFVPFAAQYAAARVCLVCHGGTICAILESFCTEKRTFYEWQPSFGHGWRLNVTLDAGIPRLCLLGEV